MIIWLASYPKSGNTMLRSMLASYFYSEKGIYDYSTIKKITQFPSSKLFQKLGLRVDDNEEMIKNYIKAQSLINKKNSITFLKTHSQLIHYKNTYPFTDLKNTLGVIYIVRDPRNVVLSYADFGTKTLDFYCSQMIEKNYIGGNPTASINAANRTLVLSGTWASNYNSWKSFKEIKKYLLIKYEDLIDNRSLVFKQILQFIFYLNRSSTPINEKKFSNVLKTTEFNNLKSIEEKQGFEESIFDEVTKERRTFFNLGPKRNWKDSLNKDIKNKIESAFSTEMKELGYL